MILVDVEIENYKQFAGTQRFTPGPNGVVGIIGTNGAGKSTLFEAIEWCLYGPREIRSDEIPPRGDEGRRPRVRVRLQHPTTSATYEIERTLRKSGASAELVEITPDGERSVIATGTTAVTSYTASKLIGLEYRAFVATFFTRQKELSFFGGLKATDRRREVGRLLGLETIRLAQQEIAEERTAKKNHAAGLQAQYEQESGERDFDAERVVLMARQAEIDTLIAQRAAELKTAEAAYNDARNAHSLLVEQFIEAQRLAGERGRHEITLQNAQAAVAAARRELDRIAAAHAERQELSERTSAIEAIGADVMRLEMLKERADHRAQLVAERETLQRDRDRLVGQIRSALVPAYTPWTSVPEQSDTPVQWIDTLVAAAAESDSTHTETQLAAVTGVLDAQKRASDAETKLEKCRSLASDLQTRLTDLLAGGDPDRRDAELNEARTEAERAIGAHTGSIASHRESLADFDNLLAHDHAGLDGSICPTCLRSFTAEELAASRAALQERKSTIEAQIARLTAESARLKERIAAIDSDLGANRARRDEIGQVRQRLANGEGVIAETERERTAIQERINMLMKDLDAGTEPTEQTAAVLAARLEIERKVQTAIPLLSSLRDSLAAIESRAAINAGKIDEIGEVKFEPAELEEARSRQQAARSALERMNFLDQLMAREPEHRQSLERAEQVCAESVSAIAGLDEQLAGVTLDQIEIDRSEMDVDALQQKAQLARTQVEIQRRERDKVDRELVQIDIDQKRLESVATRADAARIEADDLDRMYKEFNEFERYVARRVRPQLEDMTSELVRVITENKYESVELDDNYGICVWDGDLGRYPMEHFSGGERDVIALSARMALSRLIGSQAANPPSFMVLDEVFGSLDRDRRANVLDLLSSLAGSAESFQQLFVISHVDDVRLSPAFTEVWRVAESEDGSSRLENLNVSMGTEDI